MHTSSRIGTELGSYRIDALVARGRSGMIYDAFDLRAARRVALDVFDPAVADAPAFRSRFAREAREAADLGHPNIVPLYEVGEVDGELYSAARYVDGHDLRTLVQREGPLAPARALFILQQAAHALDTARDNGVPHRAVDAQAILVERHSDHVYVCDFGLGPDDVPALVPALAAVLEEMLGGHDRPPGLDAVLAKAGAGDYPTGGAFVRAARAAVRASTLPVAASPERPAAAIEPLPGERRRRRVPVLFGAVALLGGLGAAVLVAAHGHEHRSSAPTTVAPPTRSGGVPKKPVPRGQVAILLARIHDPAIRDSCTKARHPGGLATMLCSATGPGGTRIDLHVDHFGAASFVLKAMRNEAISSLVAAGGTRPARPGATTGRCNATTWLGSFTWRTDPARPGYAACFVARDSDEDCGRLGTTTCAVIYWTYQPENLYLRAAAPAGAAPQLYAWWRAHHAAFGG
jgi:hypothetical protein